MESRAGGLRAHSPSGRHPRSRPSLHRRFVQVQRPKPILHVRFGRQGKTMAKSPHPLGAGAETKADPPRTLRASGETTAKSPPTLHAGAVTKADSPRTLRATGEKPWLSLHTRFVQVQRPKPILHVCFGRVGKLQLNLHTRFVQVGRSKRETSTSERKHKDHPNRDCVSAGLDFVAQVGRGPDPNPPG